MAKPRRQRPDRPVRRPDLRDQPEPGGPRRELRAATRDRAASTAPCTASRACSKERLIDLGRESRGDARGRRARRPARRCARCARSPRARSASACSRVLQAPRRALLLLHRRQRLGRDRPHPATRSRVAEGYELRLFHVPKTIDNDLRVTDHCPGYGSAARFVAQALHGRQPRQPLPARASRSTWSWAATPAGSRRPACSARRHEDDGPHLIYVPERVFYARALPRRRRARLQAARRCLVAVSEGMHDARRARR